MPTPRPPVGGTKGVRARGSVFIKKYYSARAVEDSRVGVRNLK